MMHRLGAATTEALVKAPLKSLREQQASVPRRSHKGTDTGEA